MYEAQKRYAKRNPDKVKKWQESWRKRNKKKMRIYHREYRKNNKEEINKRGKKSQRKWKLKNKEKVKAHRKVQYALYKGNLLRKPCEICNKKKTEAHHDDYTKPFKVRWLCRLHHAEFHFK